MYLLNIHYVSDSVFCVDYFISSSKQSDELKSFHDQDNPMQCHDLYLQMKKLRHRYVK